MSAQDEVTYVALTGNGYRRAGISTTSLARLWMAKDHLLLVDMSGFAEEYKRFYFHSIQAIIVQKSYSWAVTNAVLATLVTLFVTLGLSTTRAHDDMQFFGPLCWIITAVLAPILLVQLFYGRTCRCFIKTAVQTEELPSVSRMRLARKVLARLTPEILAAQGVAPGTSFVPPTAAAASQPDGQAAEAVEGSIESSAAIETHEAAE